MYFVRTACCSGWRRKRSGRWFIGCWRRGRCWRWIGRCWRRIGRCWGRNHDVRLISSEAEETVVRRERQAQELAQRGSYDLSGALGYNTRLVVGVDTALLLDVWFVLMRPFSLLLAAASPNVPNSASALLRAARLAMNTIDWCGLLGADNCEESVHCSQQSRPRGCPEKAESLHIAHETHLDGTLQLVVALASFEDLCKSRRSPFIRITSVPTA
jgi:hypothetical protein